MRLSRARALALADGPRLLLAVRQVTVSVCKEQSPSAREDGWEPVQQLELGPGRQHESLSLDAEARFIRFHIGAGCATPLPRLSRWRPPPARRHRPSAPRRHTWVGADGLWLRADTIRSAQSPASVWTHYPDAKVFDALDGQAAESEKHSEEFINMHAITKNLQSIRDEIRLQDFR